MRPVRRARAAAHDRDPRHGTSAPSSLAVSVSSRAPRPNLKLRAHEIPVATYFSFGKLEQRSLDIDGAKLR
jgi:hypothetical protein